MAEYGSHIHEWYICSIWCLPYAHGSSCISEDGDALLRHKPAHTLFELSSPFSIPPCCTNDAACLQAKTCCYCADLKRSNTISFPMPNSFLYWQRWFWVWLAQGRRINYCVHFYSKFESGLGLLELSCIETRSVHCFESRQCCWVLTHLFNQGTDWVC